MLRQLRTGDLGFFRQPSYALYFARAEALMLMDGGPSQELDEQLRLAGGEASTVESVQHFHRFVREQAALAAENR